MTALVGRRTRDITIATEAALGAHANQHAMDVAETRRIFGDLRAEQTRMHGENRDEMIRAHERIDRVEDKVDKLPWKIIAGMAALLGLATTIIGFLIVHGLPWR